MAKLSGFCMSALLIVICLWINVCRYPNAFDEPANAAASRLTAVSQSSAQSETQTPTDENVFDSNASPSSPNVSQNAVDAPQEKKSDVRANDAPTEEEPNRQPSPPEPQGTILAENSRDDAQNLNENNGFNAELANASVSTSKTQTLKLRSKGLTAKGLGGDANAPKSSSTRAVSSEIASEPSSPRGVPARLEPETAAKLSRSAATATSKGLGASKPQGGKYVSIPSIETDAFASATFDDANDDCRVIGATRAENNLDDLAD